MTGLEILIKVKPVKRQEFLRAIEALSAPAQWAPGCVSVEVFEAHGLPNHFLWVERWPSEVRAEARTQSESFCTLLGAIKVLGELESLNIVRAEEPDVVGDELEGV